MSQPQEKDYVLGTHEAEVERLGLQHRLWRPRVLSTWRGAGFSEGQTLLDIGCGPGYATLDLAELVGPSGKVLGFDRSRRFLDVLEARRSSAGLSNITTLELDLDHAELPRVEAQGAWCRWVFAFVRHPRKLLERIAGSLGPKGVFVIHEYFHYTSLGLMPASSAFEEFVREVMASWRANGGEPNIGLELPAWLEELGFEVRPLESIVHIAKPSDEWWQWPATFVDINLRRLVELGRLTEARAREIGEDFKARERTPGTRVITPAVLEIVAVRR